MKRAYVLTSPRNLHKDPHYSKRSAGVRVFDKLAEELRKRGYEAHLVDTGGCDAKGKELIEKGAIAIYHECISSNYLNAQIVVPYIMGWWKLGGQSGPGILESDVKFYYSPKYMTDEYQKSAKENYKLSIDVIESDLFNLEGIGNRDKHIFYQGKGSVDSALIPEGVVAIRDDWPSTREGVSKLFKSGSWLWTGDAMSATADEARMCGCPVVFVPNKHFSRDNLIMIQRSLAGFAIDPSDDEMSRAAESLVNYPEERKRIYGDLDSQIDCFIEVTQKLEAKPLASPSKGKVLMVGFDLPTLSTGYASTCTSIGQELIGLGYDVYTIAGNWTVPEGFVHNGLKVLSNTKALYPDLSTFISHYNAIQPDICLFHNDLYRFLFIQDLPEDIVRRIALWVPLEKIGAVSPTTHHIFGLMDHVATVTDFAAKEVSRATGTAVRAIYHQVDTSTYRPLNTRESLKSGSFKNKFTVIRTDRNQDRKKWELTFQVWEKFAKDKTDVVLVAKTNPIDIVGKNLNTYVAQKGISSTVVFIPEFVSAERMNDLYNVSDVFLSTTGSEGFGLALAEAEAAGLPVLVTDEEPMREVVDYGRCGGLIKVKGQVYSPEFKVFYDEIDVDDAVQKLEELYQDWKAGGPKLKEFSKHAHEYASTRYDLKSIGQKFDKWFQDIMQENQMLKPVKERLLVGIVTRNRHNYLGFLLNSLLAQTYQKFDVMVMDNGDDESLYQNPHIMALFKRLEKEGHVWRLWKGDPKVNCPETHQKILEASGQYEYIFKLDDDLILDQFYLERLMAQISGDVGVGAVGGIFLQPHLSLSQQQLRSAITPTMNILNDNVQWYVQPGPEPIQAEHLYSSFIYRRQYLIDVGGFPKGLSKLAFREETLTTYKLFKKGYKLVIVPDAIAFHFQNSSGGVRSIPQSEILPMVKRDSEIFNGELSLL